MRRSAVSPLAEWFKRNPTITQFSLAAVTGIHSPTLSLYKRDRVPELAPQLRIEEGTRKLTGGEDVLEPAAWVPMARALLARRASSAA